MSNQYFDLMNSDCPRHLLVAGCKRGTVVVLEKEVRAAPYGSNASDNPAIPAGTYRIVDRKYFRAGYQTIEKV